MNEINVSKMNRRALFKRPEAHRSAHRDPRTPRLFAGGLEPYSPTPEQPWDRRRAVHLLRRTGFGAPMESVQSLLTLSPGDAVDALVDEALDTAAPDLPDWALIPQPDKNASDGQKDAFKEMEVEQRVAFRVQWLADMRARGLFEKMALFWSNHFVTQLGIYLRVSYMAQYVRLLRTHALGNFKSFVYDIGILPAMLIYLNGDKNRKGGPNENYARELLELFTMGITDGEGNPNYTQQDIVELARALTGWLVDDEALTHEFRENRHDDNDKTFLGRTGNFGYDDVIEILFEERPQAIAHFVCRKLYTFFVYAEPDEALVAELATLMVDSGFEIAPVLRTLLKSARFFEEGTLGSKIKSPVELMQAFVVETGLALKNEKGSDYLDHITDLAQELLEPPNVAGWPEGRAWVSTETLPSRWNRLADMIREEASYSRFDPLALARQMSDPTNPYVVSRELADYFLTLKASEEEYAEFAEIMLDGVPDYEWDIENENMAGGLLRNYYIYLSRLPEFQLT